MKRYLEDESNFSDAEKVAWELVMPLKHTVVLSSDIAEIKETVTFLERYFTTQELENAASKIK